MLLLCLTALELTAQTREPIQVHFDKPFYVAGEDAWYKLYFQIAATEMQSKVARVEWIAPNGRMIAQQKLSITDNYAIGDMAIPYNWQEGNYLFRAYTLWDLNFGETASFQQVIPIYNLQETPKVAIEKKVVIDAIPVTEKESPLKISLTTNQVAYHKRNEIALTIKMTDQSGQPISGQFSVSVVDGNYFSSQMMLQEHTFLPQKQKAQTTFSETYQAEQSLVLRGELKDEKGALVDTRFLSLFFPNQRTFKQTGINKGLLNLPIAKFAGTQPIQIFDMNPFHVPIPTVSLINYQLKNTFVAKPLVRSTGIANYLFLLSKYRQYRETFQQENPDYGMVKGVTKLKWEADQSYSMDQYKGLSDLASFVKEVIPDGRVVNEKGGKSIRLRYAEKRLFNRLPPWYLVNGWLTDDEALVLKLPFREIEQIDIFNSKKRIGQYLDGSMISRGLMAITTKNGKTPDQLIKKSNNLTITGYYPIRQFPNVGILDEHIPDFRPLIYWNPTIITKASGATKIRFKTSDSIGTHWINVVGQATNGEIVTTQLGYKVTVE